MWHEVVSAKTEEEYKDILDKFKKEFNWNDGNSVCNNILPQYGNMNLHIICKIYARYESCKECSYTNSHRCQSNYRVNVATVVHVALSSLCSYWAQYEQYIVANTGWEC
jgi:hypothetical protein